MGNAVDNIIESSQSNNLKENFIGKIKHLIPEIEPSHVDKVYFFGKNKKILKIVCSSISVKKSLLYEAKKRKANNIYFSELLTSHRNKLFYKLRELKRRFPSKITAVYTYDGNLFVKFPVDNKYIMIRSYQDIKDLAKQIDVELS